MYYIEEHVARKERRENGTAVKQWPKAPVGGGNCVIALHPRDPRYRDTEEYDTWRTGDWVVSLA